MYAYIVGKADEVLLDRVVVEAGGVGYELLASSMTLRNILPGQNIRLYTHLYLADGVMALYGFSDREEREMFRRLISVTRVGPKLALSVLSVMTPGDVASAVITENAAAFDRVPGMGRKTAQRVLLELKEKVQTGQSGETFTTDSGTDIRSDAIAALVSLGFDGLAAGKAVSAVTNASTVEQLLTEALKSLAK